MIKDILTRMGGVEVYGIISVCLFFTVFLGAVIWAFLHKKPFLKSMSLLPLEDGSIVKGDPRHE